MNVAVTIPEETNEVRKEIVEAIVLAAADQEAGEIAAAMEIGRALAAATDQEQDAAIEQIVAHTKHRKSQLERLRDLARRGIENAYHLGRFCQIITACDIRCASMKAIAQISDPAGELIYVDDNGQTISVKNKNLTCKQARRCWHYRNGQVSVKKQIEAINEHKRQVSPPERVNGAEWKLEAFRADEKTGLAEIRLTCEGTKEEFVGKVRIADLGRYFR